MQSTKMMSKYHCDLSFQSSTHCHIEMEIKICAQHTSITILSTNPPAKRRLESRNNCVLPFYPIEAFSYPSSSHFAHQALNYDSLHNFEQNVHTRHGSRGKATQNSQPPRRDNLHRKLVADFSPRIASSRNEPCISAIFHVSKIKIRDLGLC